jgi:L-aspartate oxidase
VSHVVVVGTGIAGLIAAIEASGSHEVTLVTKAELSESNTRYAQGGIAAALFPDDSVASHVSDTLRAGAGLADPRMARILCGEGPDRIRELLELGVAFDRENGELARGREAAHSRARVLHAGGDATGAAIEAALAARIAEDRITVLEHSFVADLIVAGGTVTGMEIIDALGNSRVLSADTVILASGGAGQLYSHTTNPLVATGDGVAAALRAGAMLSDLEFYQFHPTSLAIPGNFLVSEAVRGEGAVLLDNAGQRFMTRLHPDAELAPRDVVARGIAASMAAQGGEPVRLDATMLGADFLRERFPGISARCEAHGIDWSREPVPVTPAAHYWMGGIYTDEWGRSSLPGLVAVGEVANTGVHGANRLASNSLLESLVFAARSVRALGELWPEQAAGSSAVHDVPSSAQGAVAPVDRAALQALMWDAAGLYRDEATLADAARTLSSWVSCSRADGRASIADRETANLLDIARIVVAAALVRRESRGAHFRSDFPLTNPAEARHASWARKVTVPC